MGTFGARPGEKSDGEGDRSDQALHEVAPSWMAKQLSPWVREIPDERLRIIGPRPDANKRRPYLPHEGLTAEVCSTWTGSDSRSSADQIPGRGMVPSAHMASLTSLRHEAQTPAPDSQALWLLIDDKNGLVANAARERLA